MGFLVRTNGSLESLNRNALNMNKTTFTEHSAPSAAWWIFLYSHFIASFSILILPFVTLQIPLWIFPLLFSVVWLAGLLLLKLRFRPVPCSSDFGASVLRNFYILSLTAGSCLFLLVLFSITGWIAILSCVLGLAFLLPEQFVRKNK